MMILAAAGACFGQSTLALTRLGNGVTAYQQKKFPAAIESLKAVQGKLPKLNDYATYYLAAAHAEGQQFALVDKELAAFGSAEIASPLHGPAVLLAARALIAGGQGDEALRRLAANYPDLRQPEGDVAMAQAYAAARNLVEAARFYQRVYYFYPGTDAATRAASELATMKIDMALAYPPPTGRQMLERAAKLLALKDYDGARGEYDALSGRLAGGEKDEAQVGRGAALFLSGKVSAAQIYLRGLTVSDAEAGSQQWYYLAECARKSGDEADMHEALKKLAKGHAKSPWRLKALISAANKYLVSNSWEEYEPLYKAACKDFAGDPLTAGPSWKLVWHEYVNRKHGAAGDLREHLKNYPDHPTAGGALYFLGRNAEAHNDFGGAKVYYTHLNEYYPNYYYGVLARERLQQAKIAAAEPSSKAREQMAEVKFPALKHKGNLEASAATKLRIERSRLLRTAGLPELATAELRFGSKLDGQPWLLAVESAKAAESPFLAMRAMKSMAPGYLNIAFEEAPEEFWKLLFPMPFRRELLTYASQRNLEPHMLAALIRQESEFNPQALSRAKACGLTQVMPGTGRQLARQVGIKKFSTRMLFQPATNLQLGTYYLRSQLDNWGGQWERTLAAYNAGPNRVKEWVKWGSFEEPAEFVESIPFTETREYVQAIVRNASVYRRLYGTNLVAPEPVKVAAVKKAPASKAAVRKPATAKRAKRRAA